MATTTQKVISGIGNSNWQEYPKTKANQEEAAAQKPANKNRELAAPSVPPELEDLFQKIAAGDLVTNDSSHQGAIIHVDFTFKSKPRALGSLTLNIEENTGSIFLRHSSGKEFRADLTPNIVKKLISG